MLARRFLWLVAGLILLVLAGALAYRLFAVDLMRMTMVPQGAFQPLASPAANAYANRGMWIARPGLEDDPSQWLPAGVARPARGKAAVFFIHPTSYLQKAHWNAPLNDQESQWRARLFVRSQASAFNGIGEIWAPKYRQATFGAFLTDKGDAQRALDFAYRDVLAAFETFLRLSGADRPIVLSAHSQGSLHLMRLLKERIAGRPEAQRVAAAYVVGWPISVTADLPALGLPACATSNQGGCILSWQSFAEPADPKMVTSAYDSSRSANGTSRAGTPMLCVNPLTGSLGGAAPQDRNLGTLIPNEDLTQGELHRPGVAARCERSGFLIIGDKGEMPEMGPYVLPGNNYHVYDYALFWANIRSDAERRLANFRTR